MCNWFSYVFYLQVYPEKLESSPVSALQTRCLLSFSLSLCVRGGSTPHCCFNLTFLWESRRLGILWTNVLGDRGGGGGDFMMLNVSFKQRLGLCCAVCQLVLFPRMWTWASIACWFFSFLFFNLLPGEALQSQCNRFPLKPAARGSRCSYSSSRRPPLGQQLLLSGVSIFYFTFKFLVPFVGIVL